MGLGEGPQVWLAGSVVTLVIGPALLWWSGRRRPVVPEPLFVDA